MPRLIRRSQTGLGAEADMSRFTPGAEPVGCRPWDIGTGVRGYVWEAPEPKAVVLLQHGYGEYAQRFVNRYNRLIPHLLNAGVSVYAIDLWGHGHSPGRRALTDLGRAVDDHLAARRELRRQPSPVLAFGHSLGGLVTVASVARDQSGLRGVVLSSPFLKKDVPAWKRLLVSVLAAVGPTLPAPEAPLELSGLSRIPEELELVKNDPLIYRGRAPLLLAATALNLLGENPSRYPEWRVPTLVLHGSADTHTDPEGSRELFKAIASEDKTLHIVEGGRHELLNDTERDETLRVLLSWLSRRLPPGGE
jgi:alpha-beta hydrolase superfamily lysophospholipase